MPAESTSEQILPSDVLFRVAECLSDLIELADFRRLFSVHPTFLYVGLSYYYERTPLDCSQRSVIMLQRISSEPFLATRIRTLSIKLFTPSKWSPAHIEEHIFGNALLQASPFITRLRRLEIIWGEFYQPTGDFKDTYKPNPTIALDVFAPVLRALWMQVAPNLRELRADVYIDALHTLTALDASFAPGLRGVDLRVYGGIVPAYIRVPAAFPAYVDAQFAAIARAVVLPAADRLEELNICLVPWTAMRITGSPQPRLKDFFELIRAHRFPRLRDLGVAAPFLGSEGPLVAGLVSACLRQGHLESLLLRPTSYQGRHSWWESKPEGYLQMVREHGGQWDGLRTLSLFFDGTTRYIRPSIQLASGTIVPFMHPLLSRSSLQELSLTGDFMTVDVLRATLQALHHGGSGDTLRRLAAKVHTIRPSTLDVLFELAPFIESLDLEIAKARPDGEITPALLCSVEAEMKLRAAQTPPVDAIDDDELQDEGELQYDDEFQDDLEPMSMRRLEKEDLNALANERLFLTEMSARHFETWPLRSAVVVHYMSRRGVFTPLARDATMTATALQRSVPGLLLKEDSPKDRYWSWF